MYAMSTTNPQYTDVSAVTPEEYAQLQWEYEDFLVTSCSTDTSIHLYWCRSLRRHNEATAVMDKPTDVYPYGYHPVCEYCLQEWRYGAL